MLQAARWMALAAGPALALTGVTAGQAQTGLDIAYTISAARIPIGSSSISGTIGEADYKLSMTGRAGSVFRVLTSGDGTVTTVGVFKDGRPMPASYVSNTTAEDDTLDVKMTFEDGNVKELVASEPPPGKDRVPLTEAHRRDVMDPLTALLIPSAEGNEAACRRTLRIFDGRRRYDLKLAFKRVDKVKADKGYAGPVVVCSLVFEPIAGHRESSRLAKFLSDGRVIEMALAPVAETKVLVPFSLTVVNMLGNLVMKADRFEVTPPPALRASVPAGP